ncbi:MAG: sigma-70 family RNA polymerase sigma factor [Lachnospiraceae bacterium]|nr:sigma-70 family RNA polymerase sigma factor [Lachnospiraceae bacterium]
MTYTEAVELARNGEERGFGFLYQNTYKSKLYLALQYMKNEEDARDILQDAYMKAFTKLDSLQDPERFPAWLGQIVANTAKNALVRKNPILFSDVPSDAEEEPFEFHIEDEDVSRQPELSYTTEETRQLVRELMDSLSEEQRICILMFHIEDASIREIAEALNCSENTVKSRLNYGRKNIKKKAEDLQKKGYRLYGLAPLAFLLLLYHEDAYAMSSEAGFQEAGRGIEDTVFREFSASGKGPSPSDAGAADSQRGEVFHAQAAGASGAGQAAGAGLFHTAAGKALLVLLGAAVIGGSAYGIARWNRNSAGDSIPVEQTGTSAEDTTEFVLLTDAESSEESAPETESTPDETLAEETQPQAVAEEDYPELLEGELTQEELEFVLAYGPEELTEAGLSDADYEMIRNQFCQSSTNGLNILTEYGLDASYRRGYSVSELNRLFSVFTDYQFTEENDSDTEYGTDVDGETIWASAAELNFTATAEITDAYYTEEEMTVHFHFHKEVDDYEFSSTTDVDKTACLNRNADGNFRIVSITEADAAGSSSAAESEAEQAADTSSDSDSLRALYESVLQDAADGKYTFPDAEASTESGTFETDLEGDERYYFTADLDADGIPELVVGALYTYEPYGARLLYYYDCLVFDVESGVLQQVNGNVSVMTAYLAADGDGFYGQTYYYPATGEIDFCRVTIRSGELANGDTISYTFDTLDSFADENQAITWTDISDLSGLDQIN